MPRPHPPEFRQRAVELARMREKPVAQIAIDLGISGSCLRNWMAQADRDEGRRDDGLSTAERDELVKLRRELRVAKLENEILKRAAAYLLRRTFSQNDLRLHRRALLGPAGLDMLSSDEGVDIGLLSTPSPAGHRRRTRSRVRGERGARHQDDVASLLWVAADPQRAAPRAWRVPLQDDV